MRSMFHMTIGLSLTVVPSNLNRMYLVEGCNIGMSKLVFSLTVLEAVTES
jgi:hypothetical protein